MDQPTKLPPSTGQRMVSRNLFPAPPTFPNTSLFKTAKRRNQLPPEPPFGPRNMSRANMLFSRNVMSEPPSAFDCNKIDFRSSARHHPVLWMPPANLFPLHIWPLNRKTYEMPGSPFPYHHGILAMNIYHQTRLDAASSSYQEPLAYCGTSFRPTQIILLHSHTALYFQPANFPSQSRLVISATERVV
ncbi:hypothetical protein DFS34DRAFT_270516 [Phlyctochytrium arcticum]|nr:hypothetical protein DFS34DRAFT_270516 [Phlyctochytrium arcticum]